MPVCPTTRCAPIPSSSSLCAKTISERCEGPPIRSQNRPSSAFSGAAFFLKRVAFDRPHATRFRLLFLHVVIAKPLHTLRDMH
ncbi:hypothetical protein MES5069_80013 [Mesorhizobium escarrei]|uniref:Uncharacterized protein n=1 Tax=Mesorhizobium escarrei TaxID=666018 RepID=A0ABN8KJ63_9HYPH|nr:hypothetical protein MES5069_80013 [Mesorhizobium escarrei]